MREKHVSALSTRLVAVYRVSEATLHFTSAAKRHVLLHTVSLRLPEATFYFTFLAKSHVSFHAEKIYLGKRQAL